LLITGGGFARLAMQVSFNLALSDRCATDARQDKGRFDLPFQFLDDFNCQFDLRWPSSSISDSQ
jgi:hypothetical protein